MVKSEGRHFDTVAVDPAFVLSLLQLVERADEFRSRQTAIMREGLPRGSVGARDLRMKHAQFVWTLATQAVTVAIDHLTAWQLLVQCGTHPIFAQMTLMRGGLEGAVTCRWLVDGNALPEDRIARGVAAALDDYHQFRKFEGSPGTADPSEDGLAIAVRQIEELRNARDLAGISVVPYPKMVWLMEQYGTSHVGDSVWLYRLVSAFAHAKQWALAATERTPSVVQRPTEGIDAGRVVASDQTVIYATAAAFDHVDSALTALEEYGRPRGVLARVLGR